MTSARRKRRQRGSITPEEILTGAFTVAERDGLDRMSMTELAGELDVGVTSIYWYFRSKDDLLRKMSETVTLDHQSKLPWPGDYTPDAWRTYLSDYARQLRENYGTSDLLVDLTLMRTASYSISGTHRVYQRWEEVFALLISAGFSKGSAWSIMSMLSIYTRGFVMTVRNRRINGTPPPGLSQLGLIDEASMPILADLIRNDDIMLDLASEGDYDSGVNHILDSAQRLLDRERELTQPAAEG